jgi:hypothetical protein
VSNHLWSDTSITVPAPAGIKTGYVVVTVGNVATNGVVFRAPTSNFTLTGSLNTARWFPNVLRIRENLTYQQAKSYNLCG